MMPAVHRAMPLRDCPADGLKRIVPARNQAWWTLAIQKPPLDPDVADKAPASTLLTVYDEQHPITYLRLLDAERDGADWKEVARIVLHRSRMGRAMPGRPIWREAQWMTELGYRHLLRSGAPH